MSIKELAHNAGVSQASVTRFCRFFGLAGYPDLKLALVSEGPPAYHQQVSGDIAAGDSLGDVVSKIAQQDVQAVLDTTQVFDLVVLEEAISALAQSHKVDIYGVGASGLVGMDLALKLTRIKKHSSAYSDAHLGLTSAALLTSDDIAIGISNSGQTRETLSMMEVARNAGAKSLAITNNPHSPLAGLADFTLFTAANEAVLRSGATSSRLAQLLVIDCLFVGLAQATFHTSQHAIDTTKEILDSHTRRK